MPRWPGRLSEEERRARNIARCRRYYHAHKEGLNRRIRERRKADPEKYRKRDRKYYAKKSAVDGFQQRKYASSDREKARKSLRQWLAGNPDKAHQMWRRTYEKHKAKHLARSKRWAQNNPEARAAIMDKRRAKELGVAGFGSYTKDDDVRQMLGGYGRFCFYCSSPLKKFHVDHFIPLSRGGTNSVDNIVLSCPTCNFSKGGKLPWEWRPEIFGELRSD